MKLAGVVVLYNPSKNTLDNINLYIDGLDKLYVVDNSDKETDLEFKNKKIEYIQNGENLGIAKALNIGANKAIKDGYEWLLTMDQDSILKEKDLDEMKDFITKMKSDDYLQKILSVKYDELALVSPLHMTVMDHNPEEVTGITSPMYVMTSGNIINLNIYKKIGGFKDWLFIDSVDLEYCLNIRKNNFKILRLNHIKMQHSLGEGIVKYIGKKKIYSLNHSPIRRYYIVRNRHYVYDMYKQEFKGFCKLELSRTKTELAKILLFEPQKIKKVSYMLKGYLDYKMGVKNGKK